MNQLDFPLITVLLLLPVAGAILVALLPRDREDLVKAAAFVTTLAVLALSLPLYFGFQTGAPGFQFEEVRAWIPGAGPFTNLTPPRNWWPATARS